MNNNRAALRYAKAVLDLATEEKAADTVASNMQTIMATIDRSEDLQQLLKSPVIPAAAKKQVLQEVFKTLHQTTKNLVDLLISNKRITLLQEVASQYIARYKKQKGDATAYITTAVPLTPDLKEKIKAEVTKSVDSTIAVENKVDEDIIGGFVLRIGDMQYDASIADKLNRLKKELNTP